MTPALLFSLSLTYSFSLCLPPAHTLSIHAATVVLGQWNKGGGVRRVLFAALPEEPIFLCVVSGRWLPFISMEVYEVRKKIVMMDTEQQESAAQ